jgi:flagellar assembly protein FliH
MMRDTGKRLIEPVAAVPFTGAAVLRGVVVGRDTRALSRPRTDRPSAHPAAADDKSALAAAQQVLAQIALPHTADADPLTASYQDQGRGFQLGYEEGRQQGHAEGFRSAEELGREEGFRIGVDQGRRTAQVEAEQTSITTSQAAADRLVQLDALLAALPAEFNGKLEQAEEEMVALCFEAITRMLGEASVRPEGVRAIVRQAVTEARAKEVVTIRVNPRDLAFLQADAEIAAWLGASRRVHWCGDDRVQLGGCIVVTSEGGLDARLETQLASLAALFAKAREERRK